jgi:hypothetical protein
MARMTEEEAFALDEKFTRNPPDVKPGVTGGFFTDRRDRLVMLDSLSAGYVKSMAEFAHKTPSDIIGEMVRERIAATA